MKPVRRAAVGITLAAVTLGGCGGASELSTRQLRAEVGPICTRSDQQLNRIARPAATSDGMHFLGLGIAAMTAEVRDLRALDGNVTFRRAVTATADELAALRFTLKGLKAGNDPVVAIKTLEAKLSPLQAAADRGWLALGIRACTETE